MNLLTCFKILGLPADADAVQAKRAYKKQVRRWHPDQFPEGSGAKAGAEEQLKQINVAYAQIKEHLAVFKPAADTRQPAASARPDKVDKKNTQQTKAEKPSWIDALFKTLDAFSGSRRTPSSPPSQSNEQSFRKPSFGQVLDEMAGGRIAASKQRRRGRTGRSFQSNAGYRRHRRSGGTVDAVGGAERPGPVRPVGRVRGIGKSR